MRETKTRRLKRWILVCAWTGLIYSTLSIMPEVWKFFERYTWFIFFVTAGILFSVVFIIAVFIQKKFIKRTTTWLLLFLVLVAYFLRITSLSIPAERLHLMEYGILAFLIYRASILDFNKGPAFFLAFILTSLIGWGDEGIQYLLPNRHYQLRDVGLNSVSAALALALIYIVYRDGKPRGA